MSSRPNQPKPKGASPSPADPLATKIRDDRSGHHPDCTEMDPHYVPPGFGQIGFFTCNPPADLRNHTRCRPPYDHEHEQHVSEARLNEIQAHHERAKTVSEPTEVVRPLPYAKWRIEMDERSPGGKPRWQESFDVTRSHDAHYGPTVRVQRANPPAHLDVVSFHMSPKQARLLGQALISAADWEEADGE